MAQYREGSITLSFGASAVVGVGTRWLSNVKTGDMLLVEADGPAAFVASVLSDTELLLEQAWPGGDVAAGSYAIHRDFDPTTGAPLLAPGDTGLPIVFNRAVGRLSAQTAVAVASNAAANVAQTARDEAQAAATATAADAAATATDRAAIAADRTASTEDKWTVVGLAAAVAADKQTVVAARDVVTAGAASTAADKAATATALAQAQTLVGSAGTGTATGLVYAAAAKSLLSATDIVAVHIYDTRLDSDGGAWTTRPARSWYGEALNTATRGATRRFPTVALLVLRITSLTIYDAHDLDANGVPRMWMVFGSNATATQALYAGGGISATGIAACNGRVWVSANTSGTGGLTEINFVADTSFVRRDIDIAFNVCRGLVNRNTALASGGYLPRLVDDACNAVHARVLPMAPVDGASLPIPTVAVATATGISVIHPWGTVYDMGGAYAYWRVLIDKGGRVWASSSAGIFATGPIPYADAGWGYVKRFDGGYPRHPQAEARKGIVEVGDIIAATDGTGGTGLTQYVHDHSNYDAGMVAYTAVNYATGWQPGDIRGAWLCDTTTGSVTASAELVTNGDFTSGTTGWAGVNATLSVVGGAMRVTSSGTSYPQAQQEIATVPGQTYLLTFDLAAGSSAPAGILIGTTAGFAQLGLAVGTIGGRTAYQFTATSATTWLSTQHGSLVAGQTADYDNISVRLALPDRSYKGRGLVVNGTLTRTALPCGLAAVGGFSATNYLEQPYSSDLDFGTGDFAVCLWARSASAGGYYLDRDSLAGGARLSLVAFGARLNFAINDGSNGAGVVSATDIVSSTWHLWCAVRRGSMLELWCDGVLEATASASPIGSLSNPAAKLRLGERVASSAPATGLETCLLRTSSYAPTPAQIRRMYQDERPLIIGGMPATLGGTINNVTALSANEAAGTLAVGTDDGVSVFAGLGRVAYHDGTSTAGTMATDAVAAVSAVGPHLLIGTGGASGGVALVSDAVIARDRLAPAAPPRTSPSQDRQVLEVRGVTTDATPTDLSPRIYVGERETVALDVTVNARTYGASSTQGGLYRRLARYVRDAGGNVTLAGTVQTIGTDQETTAGMDATLQIDTAAQTVTPRVTGVAGTRIVWTARIVVTRISEDQTYAA